MEKHPLGILTDPKYLRLLKQGKKLIGAEYFNLEGEKIGASVYLFSYEDLDLAANTVTAYHRTPLGWQQAIIQLPRVIYDQAYSCPSSTRNSLMKTPGISFVNEKIGFWKWETHIALSQFPQASSYLPETYLFTEDEQLQQLLDRYGRAVLKPVYGQKAIGLILLIREENKIRYQYRGTGKERMQYHSGILTELKNIRNAFKVMGKKTYIVQQGLRLAKYQDRVFDVRVLMQKDKNQTWSSCLCAKIGPRQSEISALGYWLNFGELEKDLIRQYGASFKSIATRIEQASLVVAQALEKAFAPLGDIGLDIGIDQDGKVWLIEVNSMPAKSKYHDLLKEEELIKIYTRPIQYAYSLAVEPKR